MIRSITTAVSVNQDRSALLANAEAMETDGKLLMSLRARENALHLVLQSTGIIVDGVRKAKEQQQQEEVEAAADAPETNTAALPRPATPTSSPSAALAATVALQDEAEALVFKCNEFSISFLRDEDDAYSATDALCKALLYLVTPAMLDGQPIREAAATISGSSFSSSSASARGGGSDGAAGQWSGGSGGPPASPLLRSAQQFNLSGAAIIPTAILSELKKRLTGPPPPSSGGGGGSSAASGAPPSSPMSSLSSSSVVNSIPWDAARRFRLIALTLNNFGCIARQQKAYSDAAHAFRASAATDLHMAPLAVINLCSILLVLEKRTECAEAARYAIRTMEDRSGHLPFVWIREAVALAYHALANVLETIDGATALEAYRNATHALQHVADGSPTHSLVTRNAERYQEIIRQLQAIAAPPPPSMPPPPTAPSAETATTSGGGGGSDAAAVQSSGKRSFRQQQQQQAAAAVAAQQAALSSKPALPAVPPPNVVAEVDRQYWQQIRDEGVSHEIVIASDLAVPPSTGDDASLNLSSGSVAVATPPRLSAKLPTRPFVALNMPWMLMLDSETVTQRIPAHLRKPAAVNALAALASLAPRPPASPPRQANARKRSIGGDGSAASPTEGKQSGGKGALASSAASGGFAGAASPPKPLAAVQAEVLLEEAKKRDDVVSFLATRLTQLLRMEDYHNHRYECAQRVQRFIRPWLARCKLRREQEADARRKRAVELRRSAAARRIVRFFRRVIDAKRRRAEERERMRLQVKKRREAIVTFQKYTRRWNAVQYLTRLRRRNQRQTQSAKQIQRWIRACLSRRTLKRMRDAHASSTRESVLHETRVRAATRIQATYRMHRGVIARLIALGQSDRALKLDRQRYRTKAARTIQRVVRGFLSRRKTDGIVRPRVLQARNRCRSLALNRAATLVQSQFRAHRARDSLRTSIEDARARGRQKHADAVRHQRDCAAQTIQRAVRLWRARIAVRLERARATATHVLTCSAHQLMATMSPLSELSTGNTMLRNSSTTLFDNLRRKIDATDDTYFIGAHKAPNRLL